METRLPIGMMEEEDHDAMGEPPHAADALTVALAGAVDSSAGAGAAVDAAGAAAAARGAAAGAAGGAGAASTRTATPAALFSQTNVRKPEYWQFAKLIAPQAEMPEGKKAWTTDDAIGIWCLRCEKALHYQKGSSQSIRYHMETKHMDELVAYREHIASLVRAKQETAPTRSTATTGARGSLKRKHSASSSPNTMAMSQPLVLDEADDATLALSVQPTPPQDHALQVPTGASNATLTTTTTTTTPQTISWHKNVERRSGFWGNAYWYDYNLERRMPQVKPMVEELVAALPPCDGKTVVDVCAGSGRVASALLQAYPTALVTLVDSSEERLAIARNRIQPLHAMTQYMVARVSPANPSCLGPSVPVDTIVGCLALHVLVEKPQHYAQAGSNMPDTATLPVADQYERLFALMLRSLKPGGHFIFADHVGQLGLFHQLQLMAKVGFVDVDCAWRQDEFFVAGGQSPMPLAM